MHRLGVRHAEVAVISDDLIRKSVCTDIDPSNVDAINESDQSVDFLRLQTLSLSFQNIFKMDNLETLRFLTKLQLDNNMIQTIEGISHLIHLQWLDLSFNQITSLQGIETLVHLTDLSLYNNAITKIEHLETLQQLQVLSLGNNHITQTDGLLYLKCLEHLRVLNLSGNPVCQDAEYRPFLLAHLETLHYLDYVLVDRNEVIQAREQYQDELEELKEVQAIEDAARAREKEQLVYIARLKEANVLILETLVIDMFKEDSEMTKIEVLPGVRNLVEDYIEKAKIATEEIKTILIDKHDQLTRQVDLFEQQYVSIQSHAQEISIQAIEIYRRMAKQVLKQARGLSATESLGYLQQVDQENEKLHFELMNIESDVVEKTLELMATMEQAVEKSSNESREVATEHFRVIEGLENTFFENISQLAVTLLERMATEEAEDDDFLSDECRAILNDRDSLNNAINGSHDIHIGKLLAQEDVMREQGMVQMMTLIQSTKEKEWKRNRARIAEILGMKEKHQDEIKVVRDEMNKVEEEFY